MAERLKPTENTNMRNGAVIKGRFIVAHRLDGREFIGQIENAKSLPKGTLVVVKSWEAEDNGPKFSSFYLENLESWEVYMDADALTSSMETRYC